MQRLYLETMQEVLTKTPVVVLDDSLRGVLPLLPLNQAASPPAAPATPPPPVINAPAPPRGTSR
jgi:hypothetical protein